MFKIIFDERPCRVWRALGAITAAERRGYLWTFYPSFCDGVAPTAKTYIFTLRRETLDCVDATKGAEVFVRAKECKPFTGKTPLEAMEHAAAWLEQDAAHVEGVLDKALDWIDGQIPKKRPTVLDYAFILFWLVALAYAGATLALALVACWGPS